MAAIFDTVDKGLQRTVDIIPASQEFYSATWWAYIPFIPPTGIIRTLYMVSNSAARNTESIVVAQDDTGEIYLVVAGVKYAGIVVTPGWWAIGLRRRIASNFIDLSVHNSFSFTSSATVPFSSWTLNEMYLGVDPRRDGAQSQAAYFREWTDFVSFYGSEWSSSIPVKLTGLDTDTPLFTDLLDTTVNDHDWVHAGGGTTTFYDVPYSVEGSMGGWWRHCALMMPMSTDFGLLMKVEAGGGFLAHVTVNPGSFFFDGFHYVSVDYNVRLRYATGPSASNWAEIRVDNPFPDPGIGQGPAPLPPRIGFAVPVRWSIQWKCGTYDPGTSSYAADGHIKFFLNGVEIAGATGITLPRRPSGSNIIYYYGVRTDCDRVWARTVAAIPGTDDDGNFSSGLPDGLVYYDDFDGGNISKWTPFDWYPGGGGYNIVPNVYPDAGGDGGYGLSIFSQGPYGPAGTPAELYRPWCGLFRKFNYPPIHLSTTGQPPPPPEGPPESPIEIPGVYIMSPPTTGVLPPTDAPPLPAGGVIGPGATAIPSITFDTYYGTSQVDYEKGIPAPTIRTAFIGD